MKAPLAATLTLALTGGVSSFSPCSISSRRECGGGRARRSSLTTALLNSRLDSSSAVDEALRISKEFGATSQEARVAWDIVEEMDSSDNSAAFTTETEKIDHKMDYYNQVRSLASLMQDTKEKLAQMRQLASNLKDLELTDPSLTKLGPEAEGIRRALAEAKAAADVHGPHSVEADEAWAVLEGCASNEECYIDSHFRYSAAALRAHHTYDAVVDTEILAEAVDAFDSIDSLGRFVQVEKNRLDS